MTSTSFNQGYSLNRNSSKVIQPPGGRTADIFGRSDDTDSLGTVPSQGSSSNVSLKDGQSGNNSCASGQDSAPQSCASSVIDGMTTPTLLQQQQQQSNNDNYNINKSLNAFVRGNITKSTIFNDDGLGPKNTPKKTIATIRRNPITGEIYENPNGVQQAPIRVRQPPGGKSSGIF